MSQDCGCCATGPTLAGCAENRPGLSAIAFRAGTFASFRKDILDQIAADSRLSDLRTRSGDDYSISTVELWSAVADVLTFYQERMANESFLRTAVHRDSVQRLVRLLDYQLAPGSAATTHVAFTLDSGTQATIPARTRIQSVPGSGEKPQKFETLDAIAADARLNQIRVHPPVEGIHSAGQDPEDVAFWSTPTTEGSDTVIAPPDHDGFAIASQLNPGDDVLLFAPERTEILTIQDVAAVDGMRTITWTTPISRNDFRDAWSTRVTGVGAWKAGRSFRAFGHDAPERAVVPERKIADDPTSTYLTTATTSYIPTTPTGFIALDARYPDLKAGSNVLVVSTDSSGASKTTPLTIEEISEQRAKLSAKTNTTLATDVTVAEANVTHLKLRAPSGGTPLESVFSDVRNITIHELIGDQLRFWPYRYGDRLASSSVYIPGRRAGWSSIEFGRKVRKDAIESGTIMDINDIPPHRPVILKDEAGGRLVTGTIRQVNIVGTGVTLADHDPDSGLLSRLGLAPDQATPITALLSGRPGSINLTSPQPELSITIGSWPAQTLSLYPGGSPFDDMADDLQAAIRNALPDVPAFANARVWDISNAIVVLAGTPNDRVEFGPTTNDPLTVSALSLTPEDVQYLDGWLGAPIPESIDTNLKGTILVSDGIDVPNRCEITVSPSTTIPNTAENVRLALSNCSLPPRWESEQRRLQTAVMNDNRIAVLPPAPATEPMSFMKLSLDVSGPVSLDTASAVMLGNVAPVSHGETIADEVLGDGDASTSFQRFALKKGPLTYVPGPASQGGGSSLHVFVDGVRWEEHTTLYGASSRDQIFTTRLDDDGRTKVQFGDGTSGARPLTGRQNIRATYRQGVGSAGRLRAGQLATLLDRPTGVRAAINPLPTDGGVDPESMSQARETAPGTVRTFGRAVSRHDFEDVALLDGEVAKVIANWVWTGSRRVIHLTVAGPEGMTFSTSALDRIAATLDAKRDPNQTILVSNYAAVAVTISATLVIDPRYLSDDVLSAARPALYRSFAFDSRHFAQPVHLGEIFRVLHEVPGVNAVDIDSLDLKRRESAYRRRHGVDDNESQPHPRILVLPARGSNMHPDVMPAELATLEVPDQDIRLRATGGIST